MENKSWDRNTHQHQNSEMKEEEGIFFAIRFGKLSVNTQCRDQAKVQNNVGSIWDVTYRESNL